MDANGDSFKLKLGRIGHDREPSLARVRAAVRRASRIGVKQKGRIAPRTGLRAHFRKGSSAKAKAASPTQRRVVVKARYVAHGSGRGAPLRAHVAYLAREGRQAERTHLEAHGSEFCARQPSRLPGA